MSKTRRHHNHYSYKIVLVLRPMLELKIRTLVLQLERLCL